MAGILRTKEIAMNTKLFHAFILLAVLASACAPSAAAGTVETEASQPVGNEAGEAVLLFDIGMHIEPFGETAQGYKSGKGNYQQPQFFERHVQDILAVAGIVEAHGGRMTIQVQSPFTSVAIESGNTILTDLAARGHEIGAPLPRGRASRKKFHGRGRCRNGVT